jgi:hypothetical protein
MQQIAPLLDHLVGAGEQRYWKSQIKRLDGFEVNHRFDFLSATDRASPPCGAISGQVDEVILV